MALPFALKKYLKKAKRRIMETQIFISPCKNIIFKTSSKRNQKKSFKTLKLYNDFQVSTQAKISPFKNPHIKIDLLLLLLPSRGQYPLSYYTL
jgi:hypothetical protein